MSANATNIWKCVQAALCVVGSWLGYFVGGFDGLIIVLIVMMVIDYITGVMCAIDDHKVSSKIGFNGIFRKVFIVMMVGMANLLDVEVICTGSMLRTAIIFFYISNEGISILENASHLGLPVPEKLKDVLEQLHDRSNKIDTTGQKAVETDTTEADETTSDTEAKE
jgi:toxin secretion/phage lysis holin